MESMKSATASQCGAGGKDAASGGLSIIPTFLQQPKPGHHSGQSVGWKAAEGLLGQEPRGLPSPDNPAGLVTEDHVTIVVNTENATVQLDVRPGLSPRWIDAVTSVWRAFVH